MTENNVIYLDCNRSFASIKEEINRNIWTNEFDSIFIPKGSSISVQNALVNIQGIEGGSIEIKEDENIVMKICYYISHSNYPMPKFQYNDTVWSTDNWTQITGLNTLYTDTFTSQNTHKLFTPGLRTKLGIQLEFGISDTQNEPTDIYTIISQQFGETNAFGGMEIPLYACYFDANGYLRPHTADVKINIPKGTYGISQLSELITEQLVGRPFNKNNPNESLPTTDRVVDEGQFQSGHFKGQCIKNVNFWDYEYTIAGATKNDFPSIINDLASNDIAQLHGITSPDGFNCPVYILADQFQILMKNFSGQTFESPDFLASTFIVTNGNYIATLKNKQYAFPNPLQNRATPIATYLENDAPTINPTGTTGGPFDTNRFLQNPYFNGYFIGTNTINIDYDTTNAGFSFSNLHTSRLENSHDMLGNVLTNEGQGVSHLKDNSLLRAILPETGATGAEANQVVSSFNNPRSRSSGIEVYNWDSTIINKYKKIPVLQSRINYLKWNDIFDTNPEEKLSIWSKSFWYRIGFDFERLNDIRPIRVADQQMTTYGMTTNNQLDSSIIPTICSSFSGSQSTGQSDYINGSSMPQVLLKQLKVNDIYYQQAIQLSVALYTYKAYKNCMYQYANAFSVLTNSVKITATRLPILSDEGYFLITSDIVGSMNDVVKKKQPVPLLGIIPKSNLSNQDFINSLQEITHITSQDRVLNQIKFGIYNADLTSPQLNEKSSIILKIVLNPEGLKEANLESEKLQKKKEELVNK
jgi:hypothetical protein